MNVVALFLLFLCLTPKVKPLDFPDQETVKKVGIAAAVVGGTVGVGYMVKNLINMYRIPKEVPGLVNETNYRRPSSLREFLKGLRGRQVRLDEVKLTSQTRAEVDIFINEVKLAIRGHKSLPNALFCGPKVSIIAATARAITNELGIRYAWIQSSGIYKYAKEEERLKEIEAVIDWAKTSDEPILLIVEDAEFIFPTRAAQPATQEGNNAIARCTRILSLFPVNGSPNISVILEAKDEKKLDRGIMDRINQLIRF